MENEILAYIRLNPGCTVTACNAALRDDKHIGDWIQTAAEFDCLKMQGKIEERHFRGISTFYAKT